MTSKCHCAHRLAFENAHVLHTDALESVNVALLFIVTLKLVKVDQNHLVGLKKDKSPLIVFPASGISCLMGYVV